MALGYSPKGSPQFAEAVDGSLAIIKNGGQIEPIVTAVPSGSGIVKVVIPGHPFGLPVTHAQGTLSAAGTGSAGTDIVLASCVIPGGAIGPNGEIRVSAWLIAAASNANAKTVKIKYGGQVIAGSGALASAITSRILSEAAADGTTAGLIAINNPAATISSQPASSGSGQPIAAVPVNTDIDQILEICVNLAVASDIVTLRRWHVETTFGA